MTALNKRMIRVTHSSQEGMSQKEKELFRTARITPREDTPLFNIGEGVGVHIPKWMQEGMGVEPEFMGVIIKKMGGFLFIRGEKHMVRARPELVFRVTQDTRYIDM